MVAKAGLGIIGLGAIGIGGVAFAKPEWLGINKKITWKPLSQDHNFSSSYTEDTKFGKKYKDYLVGVVGGKQNEHLNRRMWEKLFKRWDEQKSGTGKFSATAVNGAYSEEPQTGTQKALNRVCEDAYKTEITSFGTEDSTFKKDDVWKYCSPGTLVTLTNENHGDGTTIGSDSTNKATLVSVQSNSNDWFWEQRNKDFWENTGTWSGSTGTGDSDSNKSSFRKEFDKKDSTKSDHSKRQTVKQLCEEAYKASKSDNKELTDAQKFCQLETNN